jgi:hypothetical protein
MSFRPFTPADGPAWLPRFADSVADLFRRILPAPLRLWPVATADLPDAADFSGAIVYDSDHEAVKLSDGSAWTALSEDGHAHAAADLAFTPAGDVAADNVQDAIEELDAEKQPADADLDALAASGIAAAWGSYTPTITAGSGSFTSVSAAGRYIRVGKTVFIYINIEIATNGTAASYVQATLPAASANTAANNRQSLPGIEHQATGKTCTGTIPNNSSNCLIRFYDLTYPGGDGRKISVQGIYEAA